MVSSPLLRFKKVGRMVIPEDGFIHVTVGGDSRVMTIPEMEALCTEGLVPLMVGEGEHLALRWQVRKMIANPEKKAAVFDIERYEWG